MNSVLLSISNLDTINLLIVGVQLVPVEVKQPHEQRLIEYQQSGPVVVAVEVTFRLVDK
jgi:hypothetical protein